ncbi:MAG: SH3 domain-containing protein [Chloroflexota bacterium]
MHRRATALIHRGWWPLVGALLLAVVTAGCSLGAGGQPAVDGPPEVAIAPGIGSAPYCQGVTINIQAAVANTGDDIALVEITVGDETIAQISSPNPDNATVFTVSQPWLAERSGTQTVRVSAVRGDGTRGEDTASINVVAAETVNTATQPTNIPANPQPTQPAASTQQPVSTQTPATIAPATATPRPQRTNTASGIPQAIFDRQQNVRTGPGTNFTRLGTFAPNDRADILAQNLDGTWYKVRFQGGQAWVYAPYVTVEGSLTDIPREAGPPTPIPPPTAVPTAVPPPTEPPAQANLVVENIGISVPADGSVQPKCGVPFIARMTIRNTGTTAASTGLSRIENRYLGDNSVNASSGSALVPVTLQPGDTHTVEFMFTVTTNFDEQHRVVFITDVNNEVAETNEQDNENGITYTLERAGC